MVEISFGYENLLLEVKGTHKWWALASKMTIPLAHINGVHHDPKPAMGWFQGLKIAGTDLPNLFRAGYFWQDGDRVFWDVRHPKKTIVIELEDEKCAKLIVEVKDVAKALAEIETALESYRRHRALAESEVDAFLEGAEAVKEVES